MAAFTIRLATVADLEAIRAIYNHYVAVSTCTYALEPETAEEKIKKISDWITAGCPD